MQSVYTFPIKQQYLQQEQEQQVLQFLIE